MIVKVSCLSISLLGPFALSHAEAQDGSRERPVSDKITAIVEEISIGDKYPVQFDLLKSGTKIELNQGKIVLGYLETCWQDTVSFGRVKVGRQRSTVEGGFVSRRRVECDTAGLARITNSPGTSRGLSSFGRQTNVDAGIILYGRSPIIVSKTPSQQISIRNLDQKLAPLKIMLKNNRIDAADHGIALLPDTLYRASNGKFFVDFRIDKLAETGKSPAVGRLLILN